MRTTQIAVCALLCLTILAPAARADRPLPRDEKNVEGQFDNGLKYIIRANANPPGRVQMNLYVRTGAINETDQQNGIAHFLEHMAFEGSTHFKPGELIPLLSKLGMQFGADSNAYTTHHQTVYQLNLPDVKPETLEIGLKIFSDYASGLLLTDEEINSERGIILEERRLRREGAAARIDIQRLKTLFPGTKLENHDVAGIADQIKTFPRDQFVDYWNTWYRPENMTLLVVGDIKPDEFIAQAKPWLGEFKARGDAREPSKMGLKPTAAPAAYVFTDPEEAAGTVTLMSLRPPEAPVTTVEQDRRETIRTVAMGMVNRRLRELVNAGKAPFRVAFVGAGDYENAHEALRVGAQAVGEPKDWNAMLDTVITEISRAIDHGFTKSEFELAKAEWIASAEEAVKTESTRDSEQIISQLVYEVSAGRPHTSAQQELDLLKPTLASATLDELHQAFTECFKTRNFIYIVTMPSGKEGVSVLGNDDVLAAANAAWARKTEAPQEKKLGGRLLAADPTPGKVATTATDSDLALTNVTFENGVVMHHKFVDYKKDQVIVNITLPGGRLEETPQTRGYSSLASVMLMQPATSKFTSTQIDDLMTGKNVRVFGAIGTDAMSITVAGTPADLPAGLELAHAILTDGRLEQSAVDDWKKNQHQALQRMKVTPTLALMKAQAETFYGGDPRFTPPTDQMIDRLERNAAEAWFHRIADNAAIEVAIVGDMKLEPAVELVSRYLGSLPKRTKSFDALDSVRAIQRGPGPYARNATFPGVTPQSLALAGFVSCNVGNPDRRPLSLAALILTERMTKRIREQEQLAYSIDASNQPGTIPGTGMFMAASMTDPAKTDKLADTVLEMFKEFAAKGPTEEELTTAKKQKSTELATSMKEPAFWANEFRELVYRKRPIEDVKALPGVYETYSARALQDVFAKYMKDDAIIRFVVIPEPRTSDGKPTTAPSAQPAAADVGK